MQQIYFFVMLLMSSYIQVNAEAPKKPIPLQNITVKTLDAHPTEIDSNGDGKTDIWHTFSWNGKLESATYDNDFDGKVDEWLAISGAKKQRIQITDPDKNLRTRTTESMNDAGITEQIITEDESTKNEWQLSKRQTYVASKKIYKIEIFQNGQLKEESTTPAEVH